MAATMEGEHGHAPPYTGGRATDRHVGEDRRRASQRSKGVALSLALQVLSTAYSGEQCFIEAPMKSVLLRVRWRATTTPGNWWCRRWCGPRPTARARR